jgi:hypothetical protein
MSQRQTRIAGFKTVELYAVLKCLDDTLVASRMKEKHDQLLFSVLPPNMDSTEPPILPSVVNCLPMMPSLSNGPPIFWAVPPIAPVSAEASEDHERAAGTCKNTTCELLANGTLFVEEFRLGFAVTSIGRGCGSTGSALIAAGGHGCLPR